MTGHARIIWDSALAAVRPQPLTAAAVARIRFPDRGRILVVGGGKAAAAMAAGVEEALADRIDRVEGIVTAPDGGERPLRKITVQPAREIGRNEPTEAAAAGVERMLDRVANAEGDDTVICLLSGGGSALLPAPVVGVSLADKITVTRWLVCRGATIAELNCVRKHLSRVKGGGLVRACRAGRLVSLIVSDVIGDPLDVIASGPTAADPSTFDDALAVLARHELTEQVPKSVMGYLKVGAEGGHPETLKVLPEWVENRVIANNRVALDAAARTAAALGYRVIDLGPDSAGDTETLARAHADLARTFARRHDLAAPPTCVISGGETTVPLPANPGRGGRNQQYVLAAILAADPDGDWEVLSGGTDGEDGPTDAAGATATPATLAAVRRAGLDAADHLRRCDAYPLFDAVGGLIRCGLTGTNVMDVRIWIIR